jgi:antitoxin (DNA-binding transcriptional repressor) of toxin-antitoxin stability system
MKAVAIKELKNRLSAYLREVAGGETVLVTDRGKVVAELRRPSVDVRLASGHDGLERLRSHGLLTAGLPNVPTAYRRTRMQLRGATSQELLDAERGEQ